MVSDPPSYHLLRAFAVRNYPANRLPTEQIKIYEGLNVVVPVPARLVPRMSLARSVTIT